MVHRWHYHTIQDSLIPIQNMIHRLESQGVISKAHSPFDSPVWPVRKSSDEWKLTVDYHDLNEVMPPLNAAVRDMLELPFELESKAAQWYAATDIVNAFFSIHSAAECRPQVAFTWRGIQEQKQMPYNLLQWEKCLSCGQYSPKQMLPISLVHCICSWIDVLKAQCSKHTASPTVTAQLTGKTRVREN
ncbi:hypothetical protein AV530_000237 [Patagioenas fasciata monilis]|uniref:Reverse transcriptase domain-containing protein n=1 Tax=Patagioenas fasciata monilis TaxID=372326 RepID=A0A1V4J8H0_PATFA|nr:hypothetical protein AV530_000237 [Patagioenas fasciata monilis]